MSWNLSSSLFKSNYSGLKKVKIDIKLILWKIKSSNNITEQFANIEFQITFAIGTKSNTGNIKNFEEKRG